MLQLSLPSPTHSGRLGLPQRAARLVAPPHSAAQDLPLRQRGARWSRLVTRESPQGAASRLAPFQEPEYLEEEVAKQAVDRVLELIKDTENGEKASAEQREEIDSLLNQLEVIGEGQVPRPLDSPLIYGNYNVAYVSQGTGQRGQPAGGRFRTGVGKLLFGTVVLAQSVLEPDVVTNKLGFSLLGLLGGAVGLRGKLVAIPEKEGGTDNRDTVKVFFDPPVISLPGSIHTRIGGDSTVVLKTTYLDDRVRLGRGSRGSLFVFTRGGQADLVGMDQVGLERSSPLGLLLLYTFLAALVGGGAYAASRPALPPAARAAGLVLACLGLGLGWAFYSGGQLDDNDDRGEVAKPAAKAADAAAAAGAQ